MYTPLTIANTICIERPGRFRPLQLVQMVHLVQGWGLGYGMDVCSETPICWQYGPAHESLSDTYRSLGMPDAPVTHPVIPRMGTAAPEIPASDHRARRLVLRVVEIHETHADEDLADLLTGPGSPWRNAYGDRDNRRRLFGTPISKKVLQRHYSLVVEQAQLRALRDMRTQEHERIAA